MRFVESRIDYVNQDLKKPYFIRYNSEVGRFGKEDHQDKGLTQDLIFVSCITNPDGSYSQDWVAIDGQRDAPLAHDQVFKAWALMANNLMTKPDIRPEFAKICEEAFTAFRKFMLS